MIMKVTMAEFVGLEPCPFCGGKASIVDHHNNDGSVSVGCANDTCLGFSGLGWLYRTEAEAIKAGADKDAKELKAKAESDIRMASAQCLQATKKDIENLLVGRIEAGKVSDALRDTAFIKEIIKAVAARFDAEEASDLSLILPESQKAELEPWVAEELAKTLKGGVQAGFSKKIGGGFTIGPADGGWFVSLTEQTFNELIAEYLRPVTRKLLFGE